MTGQTLIIPYRPPHRTRGERDHDLSQGDAILLLVGLALVLIPIGVLTFTELRKY